MSVDVYLLAQGVVTPATIVTACSAALSPLYNWLLVDYFEVGLAGAALANDAVQVISFIMPLAMFIKALYVYQELLALLLLKRCITSSCSWQSLHATCILPEQFPVCQELLALLLPGKRSDRQQLWIQLAGLFALAYKPGD